MSEIPTAEQFKALAAAYKGYYRLLEVRVNERTQKYYDEKLEITDDEITNLAILFSKDIAEIWAETLKPLTALEWLENQPSFMLAKQSIGFNKVDQKYFEEIFEHAIRVWAPNIHLGPYRLTRMIDESSGEYNRYVSRVAEISYEYLTRKRVRAVIDGPAKINRMKSLLAELEQLINNDWMNPYEIKRLSSLVDARGAINYLDEPYILGNPSSRRNDADLPARLMASSLIGLNRYHFSDPHKRAVFHLMGLPFVERPLEMRTIERLISRKSSPKEKRLEDSATENAI